MSIMARRRTKASEKKRKMVALRDTVKRLRDGGFSNAEISRRLNIPESSVRYIARVD